LSEKIAKTHRSGLYRAQARTIRHRGDLQLDEQSKSNCKLAGNGLYAFFVLILRTFLTIVDFVQALYRRPGSERLFVIVLRFIFDLLIFVLMWLMQLVVSINSRKTEFRAMNTPLNWGMAKNC
jgi:hypothetical protein